MTTMGNGLTVLLVEDHAVDVVAIDVWVKAGSACETAANSGVSHFVEHMVFGRTIKREPGDMDNEMESLGAELGAHTSRDWAHFSTTVSTRYLSKALEVLADAMQNAQFKDQEVERERMVILDEIAKKRTNPIKVCKDYLAAEIYGTHPYARPVEGTVETLKKLTPTDITDYYRKYYVPKNMAVVLVGNVDKQKAVSAVGEAFQGLSGALAPQPTEKEVAPLIKQINKTFKEPLGGDFLAIGFLGPPASEYKDVCATDVALSYLGFGYRSWMAEELKGKLALATEASADFLTEKQRGMISLMAAVTEGNASRAKGAIFARIASLQQDGIQSDRLALAKRSLLGQYAFENETYGGQANSLGFYHLVSEAEFASKYIDCVQSVTNDDVMRVAKLYMSSDKAVVLTVGPNQGGQN